MITRREACRVLGAGLVGAAAAARGAPAVLAAGANDRVVIGAMGMSRGLGVVQELAKLNVRIAYVCDPDQKRLDRARAATGAEHAVTDVRRVLDDKAVDAVVIATPDHWHAPMAILACAAGKHVYVEKPCSHNIREGQWMIEAARRHDRVMQVGTQSRGTPTIRNAVELLHDGAIGKVLVAKAWNSQRRANIGHATPSDPPSGFDYDLWVGPAPMRPYQANCQHGTWHWWYDFGTGDAGNDGVHELDIASWGLGVDTHPSRVSGHGSKMFFDDDQQFPDTQYVVYEYPPKDAATPKRLLVYEHRIWSPYHQEGAENGCAFYGTEGYMILAKATGWKLYGPRDKLIREEAGGLSMPDHAADFLAAIRDHRRPNADIEIADRAAVLAHLANILARTGRPGLAFDPKQQQFIDAPDADALVGRAYRENHWAVPAGV